MSNILFLGGGRRVELAKRFADHGHTLFSYELNKNQPISKYAKIIEGLEWINPNLREDLNDALFAYKIDLVIPLQDQAVLECASLKAYPIDKTLPTKFLCSPYGTSLICFDKLFFSNYMMINHPQQYPYPREGADKLIKKERFGYGSKGIEIISETRMPQPYDTPFTHIFQRYVTGEEYSVDCYFSSPGNFVDAVPRQRIRVAGGEVISSKTVENEILYLTSKIIGMHLGLVGPANFQYILSENENFPMLLEINARFGGGMTLSMEAGLDMVSLIERDYFGKEFNYVPNQWKRNLLLERSYRDHFYEDNV